MWIGVNFVRFSREQLILFSVEQDNILPITSICNLRCVFCSHAQNPSNVEICRIGMRTLSEIESNLQFLDSSKKIVIGESATRIIEGEPFLHPQIRAIIKMIRQKFPKTPLQITTNGTLLTSEELDFLQQIKNLELCISLNSITKEGRHLLMGARGTEVFRAISELDERGITYQGSIVALPWIVGWEDLKTTTEFLDKYRAETIRIFLPGYTKNAPDELQFRAGFPAELSAWVEKIRKDYQTPIVLEPPFVDNLRVVIDGVIHHSPAELGGFLLGDEILKIDQKSPFSRVDAFFQLFKGGSQEIVIKRKGEEKILYLEKKPKERSGLVFAQDLSPKIYLQVLRHIRRWQAKRPILMVSTLATPLLKIMVGNLNQNLSDSQLELVSVPNRFFGGSIMAAGLLVIDDFIACWSSLADHNYDLVLIPDIFLDPWGYDLVGEGLKKLETEIDTVLEVIEV